MRKTPAERKGFDENLTKNFCAYFYALSRFVFYDRYSSCARSPRPARSLLGRLAVPEMRLTRLWMRKRLTALSKRSSTVAPVAHTVRGDREKASTQVITRDAAHSR